jgi:DNA-binding Lrp family transcriptional regulator
MFNEKELLKEKKLLTLLQKDFPLEERPFLKIAQELRTEEEKLIEYLKKLEQKGILRQISAIFNPSFFGHSSSLFAAKVEEKNLKKAIETINQHPGVTHNYLRPHEFNLWFILVVLPGVDIVEESKRLARKGNIKKLLYLPVLRTFKISTVFGIEVEEKNGIKPKRNFNFSERDKKFVKILQEPLPLEKEPFKKLAKNLGTTQEELFKWIKEMKSRGALRRFGALLKHDRIGFKTNVMVAWKVEKDRVDFVGRELARNSFITHCYERKSYPEWAYTLYTMCHFKEEKEKELISELADRYKIKEYILLQTLKELKKKRLKLFYSEERF